MVKVPRLGTRQGSFEITFNPFELANASHDGFELRKRKEIGPGFRYDRSPASIVTPRQFTVTPQSPNMTININDAVTRDTLAVDWRTIESRRRVDLEEITFMIIGEVSVEVVTGTPDIPVFLPASGKKKKSSRGRSSRVRRKSSRRKRGMKRTTRAR
jgi:hypothetical protein